MDICDFSRETKSLKSLNYKIPDIQRNVIKSAVQAIYDRENKCYSVLGKYLLPGTVSIVQHNSIDYLIDGQHRMVAYEMLSRDFPEREMSVRVDYYKCTTEVQMENIYKIVNTSNPNDITRMSVDVYKLRREVYDFFKKQFPSYLRSSARPFAPNINIDSLMTKLESVNIEMFHPGEFPRMCLELNKFYSTVPTEKFQGWSVEGKHLDSVRQKPNQMFLGVYREYEWVDRIVQLKELRRTVNGVQSGFDSIEHFSLSHRVKITKALRRVVWNSKSMEQPCICCGDTITFDNFHCGHIIAAAKGGATTKENLRPVCATCNTDMGTMDMNLYRKLLSDQLC